MRSLQVGNLFPWKEYLERAGESGDSREVAALFQAEDHLVG